MTRPPGGYQPRDRLRQALTGVAAFALLTALLGGIPWALVHYIGWPLPHALPTGQDLRDGLTAGTIPARVLLDALALAVWAGWAVLTAAITTETVAAACGLPARRVRPAGPLQPVAVYLVGAVVLAVLALLPRPAPTGHLPLAAGLSLRPASTITLQQAHFSGTPAATAAVEPAPAERTESPATSPYVVVRRDTLWGIADRQLGDPLRWSQIYALNQGRTMPDGRTFDDPNQIWPGWTLLLPAGASLAPSPSAPSPPTAGTPPTDLTPRTPTSTPQSSPTAGPESQPSTHLPPDTGQPASGATHVVELPSGSVIGGSFAAGLAAALLLGRLRRRHGYRPHPPEPGRCLTPPQLGPTLRRLTAAARPPNDDDHQQAPSQHERAGAADGHQTVEPVAPMLPADNPDRRERPDLIDVGTTDPTGTDTAASRNEPLTVSLTDLLGAALTGAGADDTARAWLAAVLVRAGPLAAEILITTACRDRLLPGLPDLPGIRAVATAEALLRLFEVEVFARTRQLDNTDTTDLRADHAPQADDDPSGIGRAAGDAVSYRRAQPYEPLPTLVAVLDAVPPDATGRWQATLNAGGRLGLGALILAPTDAATTRIDVRADHTAAIDAPVHLTGLPASLRLFGLTATETVELLTALGDTEHRPSSDEPEKDPARYDQREHRESRRGSTRHPDGHDGRPRDEDQRLPRHPASVSATSETPGEPLTQPWPDMPNLSTQAAPPDTSAAGTVPAGRPGQATPARPITVQLLGPYVVSLDGEPVRTGLRNLAKELLAWYLLRPDGATVDAAIDALWPDTDPAMVHRQFWHAAANLRSRLRANNDADGGDRGDVKVLVQTGDVYRPQAEVISCDLWEFQDALGQTAHAERAGDLLAARDALQTAVAAYRGDFAGNAGYLWAEPVRHDLHRRALDAHLRLAEIDEQLRSPEAAVLVLENAVALDQVAEEPYRRLMAAQARLGRPDAVRATWRALQRCLADIDVDAEPATLRLYRSLTDDTHASPTLPPARGTDAAPLRSR